MQLIARNGAAAATQRSVAEAAGVSLASTTYHFGTRAELLAATLERASSVAITEMGALRDEVLHGRSTLLEVCLRYIDQQRSGQSPTAAVVFELALGAARERRLRAASDAFLESLRSVFAPFTTRPGADLAAAESFCGVLLFELSRGPEARSARLEATVTAVLESYGISIEEIA
jgi:AcrR family transcriptional regulator